jgi:TolB-like protein
MAFGQVKPRLAILPFTGGTGGDGETIAALFSYEKELSNVFTIIPRTSSIEAIMREQQFQRSSGLTDSDTIARLGRQYNADYVVSGHIQTLGSSKLVLITIIHVESLRQIAGDYKEYTNIEEVQEMIPSMAGRIVTASRTGGTALPQLAILPFAVPAGVNQSDAEVLAQLLSVEIANSGKYAVLPRTATIQTVMEEHQIQRSGVTEANSIKVIGNALNAQYVLAGSVRSLGRNNMFTAEIINIENAAQLEGSFVNYQAMADGLSLMAELGAKLTNIETGRYVESERYAEPERPAEPARREVNTANAADTARKDEQQRVGERFFGAGANLGLGFGNDAGLGFNIFGNVNATVPLVWRLFADAGADIGFSGSIGDDDAYKNPQYRAYRLYARLNIGIPVAVSLFNFDLLLLPYAGVGYGYTQATYEFEFESYGTEETGTKTQKYTGVDLAFGVILTERHHGIRAGVNLNSVSNGAFSETQLMLGYMFRF